MLSGDIFHGKTSRNEISHSWISQGEFTYGEIFPGEISQRGYFHAVKLPRCKISRRQIPGETSTQEGISDPDYAMLLPFDQLLGARTWNIGRVEKVWWFQLWTPVEHAAPFDFEVRIFGLLNVNMVAPLAMEFTLRFHK